MIAAPPSTSDLLLHLGRPLFPDEVPPGTPPHQAWSDLMLRHGPAGAAARVGGDFAVALRLADGRLFLAVDRFAVRSLCWRLAPDGLRCAARADDLAKPSSSPSTQAIFNYLYFHVIPSPDTVFDGVHRLPAAHCAVFDQGKLELLRYWTPEFKPQSQPSFDSLKQEFLGLLQQAVARQVDAGKSPACFLSGGTDSSTVAGMLSRLGMGRPVCYSVGFEAEGYDEMAYARTAARHFGCDHREIYFTPDDLAREIPAVAAAYDQPFGNSSALPSYHCSVKARNDGVDRILAGDGGDELFGGNARYATQRLFDHWQKVPQSLRDWVLGPVFRHALTAQLPLLRKGASYVRQAETPMPDRAQDYNLIKRIGYQKLFTPAFMSRVDTGAVDAQQRAVWLEAGADNELDRHLAFDWRYTLAECDLPKVVGTTGLGGLSVGFPMLDRDLVDFSLRLPSDYKVRGPALRWFFKEALRGFLPDEILVKKKQGFGLPFGVWMVQHSALNTLARDALQSLEHRRLLRGDFVHEFFDHLLPQHPHYYGTMAWILIMLEHWVRAHAPNWSLAE